MVIDIPNEVDPEGDLVLVAFAQSDPNRTPVRLRVCSQALRRASPVWKKMLYDDFTWKESKPADGRKWEVELPKDDIHPLKMLLSIIHGMPQRLEQCSIEEVHQILILTHKYDMVKVIKPWSDKWLDKISKHSFNLKSVVRALFIAYELGSEKIFAEKLEYIAMHTEIDSQDRLVFRVKARTIVLTQEEFLGPGRVAMTAKIDYCEPLEVVLKFMEQEYGSNVYEGEGDLGPDCIAEITEPDWQDPWVLNMKVKEQKIVLDEEEHLGPLSALKAIGKVRSEMMQEVTSLVHNEVELRTRKEPYCDRGYLYEDVESPLDETDTKKCDIMVVGAIYHAMIQTRGAPLSEHAEDIEESVVDLASWVFYFMSKVEGLHEEEPCAPRWAKVPQDWESNFRPPNFPKAISERTHDKIEQVVRRAIEPQHLQYMARQRAITEVSSFLSATPLLHLQAALLEVQRLRYLRLVD
ncbi:hypothetical protein B0T20DRAFT_478071 [Sordaria brevicollis]|uniref:BTB domain-containing protein n=1 Tax=Sordaria brevicollis TaxID=83679 RepID=A0AAE0PI01_SORBR|nr:hypothetical protein B0T20DRAFT_478071 [Sordaria brevicollis]